ncbi:MAG: phosphate propanoyltransferase [Liquorilactobacillus ghanensis]|uniref:Phosphate propanoyltransferase n=1 Tax=Liquorilactobacillus ghanensis DSM 18630 TaxID=1423750 RepID=A0A0R1VUC6_9LACO|nr:phosphate propanoyltransferase [Liquorilactobacillus ghanensis]KRM06310.1 propanediol utilization protein [Liquorilactobacillus ghanensis DSM 18630]
MDDKDFQATVREVLTNLKTIVKIPVGISNHHIHLTETDYKKLFPHEAIKVKKELNQPGEFASEQMVTIKGPRGKIARVRILGPFRSHSQVEVSLTDARKLGIKVPIRLSGNLDNTPGIDLESEYGSLHLNDGVIVAKRHIHMSEKEAALLGVKKGDTVSVSVDNAERPIVFQNVEIRPGKNFKLEMHLDTDEANAGNISGKSFGKIIS